MKKYIFMAAVASLAIVSCNKDEVKEVNAGREIDFHTAVTRGTETTIQNLGEIYVTAYTESENNYFTDVLFAENAGYFTSDVKYYWPTDGSNINFMAYAPSAAELGAGAEVIINKNEQKLVAYSPAADVTAQEDVLVAKAVGSKADADTGVELVFDHVLSQVEFKAYNNNDGYVMKVKGVKLANVAGTGDCDLADKVWSTAGYDKVTYEVTYETPITLTSEAVTVMNGLNNNAMLVPQAFAAWDNVNDANNEAAGTYVSVLVNITTKEGALVYPKTGADDYAWMATPLSADWKPGFKYVYNLDVSDGGLVEPDTDPDPDPAPSPGPGSGSSVLGGAIKIDGYVFGWDRYGQSANM